MKIFVDTNVWLAGYFGSGLCAALLEVLVQSGAKILLDERVLGEFRRIAQEKFRVDAKALAKAERFFAHHAQILNEAAAPAPGVPDPDDAWIIAAALGAGADLFVTGDKALLALGEIEGLPIVDVRTAYERLHPLR